MLWVEETGSSLMSSEAHLPEAAGVVALRVALAGGVGMVAARTGLAVGSTVFAASAAAAVLERVGKSMGTGMAFFLFFLGAGVPEGVLAAVVVVL